MVAIHILEYYVTGTEVVLGHTIVIEYVKSCLFSLLGCGENALGLVAIEEVGSLADF